MIFNYPSKIKLILLWILAIGATGPLFCQDEKREFADLRIPPMERLVDSAYVHSPLLVQQDAIIRIREWQAKSTKNEWEKYLLFFSEMRYGSVDILVSNGGSITYGDRSNSTRYNVGARVQMSIFDLLDQKRRNVMATEQINVEKGKKDELLRMIRDDVIRLWSKLTSYQEIVAINEDHRAAQSANFQYAEQQFERGDIALVEYARIKEIFSRADQEYQLALREFRETYLLLESLIGIKLTDMN